MVAGDPKQALYHDIGMGKPRLEPAGDRHPDAAVSLDPADPRFHLGARQALDVVGREHAFEGEPVDFVWATNRPTGSRRRTRRAVAPRERRAAPQDIGVLVTRKWAIGGVARALEEADVPCRAVYPNQAEDLDLTEPKVKIITVHSAKGSSSTWSSSWDSSSSPTPTALRRRPAGAHRLRRGHSRPGPTRAELLQGQRLPRAHPGIAGGHLAPWVWPDDYPEA